MHTTFAGITCQFNLGVVCFLRVCFWGQINLQVPRMWPSFNVPLLLKSRTIKEYGELGFQIWKCDPYGCSLWFMAGNFLVCQASCPNYLRISLSITMRNCPNSPKHGNLYNGRLCSICFGRTLWPLLCNGNSSSAVTYPPAFRLKVHWKGH